MLSSKDCESLAIDVVRNYLMGCQPQTSQDCLNALTKLCSVVGTTMAGAAGSELAVDRLEETADFVARRGAKAPIGIDHLLARLGVDRHNSQH